MFFEKKLKTIVTDFKKISEKRSPSLFSGSKSNSFGFLQGQPILERNSSLRFVLFLILFLASTGIGRAWTNGNFTAGLTGWTTSFANPGLANGCTNPSATVVNATTVSAKGAGVVPNSDGLLPNHPACSPDAVQLWPSHGEANHGDWVQIQQTDTVPTNGNTCFTFWFAGVFENYHYLQGQTANNSDSYLLVNMIVGGAVVASLNYSWETTLPQIIQLTNAQVPAVGDGTVCDINGTPNNWGYVPWTEYEINLCQYAGQQVTFQATFYDCDMGGHYGFGNISCLNWNSCPPPAMKITKANTPSGLVSAGQTITYTINYSNAGTGPADGVVINDTIPNGTTFVPGSMTSNPIAFFTNQVGNDLIWDVGYVAAGATGSLSFKVTAPDSQCVTFTNVAAETDLTVACGTTPPLSNPVTNWLGGCTPTPIPTHTATTAFTSTPSHTPTVPPTATATTVFTTTPTNTPTPQPTATAIAHAPTSTPTNTFTALSTNVATAVAQPSNTPTVDPTPMNTVVSTVVAAATPTRIPREDWPTYVATALAAATETPVDPFRRHWPDIWATAVAALTATPTNTFTPSTPIVATAVVASTMTPTNTFTPSTPIVATVVAGASMTPTLTFTPVTPIVATAVAAVAHQGSHNNISGPGAVTAWPNILKASSGSMVTTFHTDSSFSLTLNVSIYTIAGELIQVIDGSQGSNQATWNATGLASGVYLAVVEEMDANGGLLSRQTVKIAVIK